MKFVRGRITAYDSRQMRLESADPEQTVAHKQRGLTDTESCAGRCTE